MHITLIYTLLGHFRWWRRDNIHYRELGILRNAEKPNSDRKGNVDVADVGELIFLKTVVKETLRLHPPLPLLVPRECREM